MKYVFWLIVILSSLFVKGCGEEDPNAILNVEITYVEETLEMTSSSAFFDVEIIDKGDVLSFELHAKDDYFFSSRLVGFINGIKLSKSQIIVDGPTAIFTINHPNPRDPEAYEEVMVTFDLNGGSWTKEIIDELIPSTTLNIQAKDDLTGETFSLFDHDQDLLRWYYKLFLLYDETVDAYRVVATDHATASIANLELPNYDYVIGVHLSTNDLIARDLIMSYTLNDITNMLIRFNIDLLVYEEGDLEVSIYEEDILLGIFTKTYTTIEAFPIPYRETFSFQGWSDGTKTYYTYPGYKIKEGVKEVNYIAQWEGASETELKAYIDEFIPPKIHENIDLPTSYSHYDIVWESSDPEVLDPSGQFHMPYQDVSLTLTALATSDSDEYTFTYTLETTHYKSLANPIASGYIYRNYHLLGDDFFETLDIINTAFIKAESDGTLTGTTVLSNIETYIKPKAKLYGNWIIPSISPDSAWSTIAKSPSLVEAFANNIVTLINTYGFSGVDIDWETPTDSETTLYVNMMEVIYQKVKANNPNHLVTTAITGGMWQPPRYGLSTSKNYVDYINMMTYGMVNGGGQYQNALYPATSYLNSTLKIGKTLTSCSIKESVELFRNQYQVPYDKIIVGVAFYGISQSRSYDETTQTWSSWTYAGALSYSTLQANYIVNATYTKVYDERAGVPYMVNQAGTLFISYDNQRSILEKSAFIIEEGLAGMMYWEQGHDSTGVLLHAMYQGLKS
ncbi:MAG: glycoside hydrolase family 18 protein [Acholeplasma sp.]|jgi:chitinase|nr:MAG: glycoside hydrolase family 18 protein [Acholeplasma sp.]